MANRETRRKQKINKSKKNIETTPEENSGSLIKIGLIVIGIFVIFYVITVLVTGDINFGKDKDADENINVSIQYNEILAGETFNMDYNEYFVIYYDFSDSSSAVYNTIMRQYKEEHEDVKIFTVDTSKGFNLVYIGENSNSKANKIDDLIISGDTLIKIKNKKNILYSEGMDAIREVLK